MQFLGGFELQPIVLQWLLLWGLSVLALIGIAALFSALMWMLSKLKAKVFVTVMTIVVIGSLGWFTWFIVNTGM